MLYFKTCQLIVSASIGLIFKIYSCKITETYESICLLYTHSLEYRPEDFKYFDRSVLGTSFLGGLLRKDNTLFEANHTNYNICTLLP